MTVRLLCTLCLLFGMTLVGPPAVGATAPVQAAGEMTLHADGSRGLRLTGLPASIPYEEDRDLKLSLEGASFAVVLLDTGPGTCGADESIICPRRGKWHLGGRAGEVWSPGWSFGAQQQVTHTDGTADVYIVADGPVTVELRFEGLPGAVELDIVGDVDARLKRLPIGCHATDCEHLRYGGLTHDMGPKGGLAASFGLSWNPPPTPVPSVNNVFQTNSIMPCVYPHRTVPDASPDPAAHPTGCDFVPVDGTVISSHHLDNLGTFAVQAADGGLASPRQSVSFAARGDAYVGYVAERYNPFESDFPGGGIEAVGVWLQDGITCPASGCGVAR